ncbi:MAG: MFS transporter, partial [Gammaproteobacteria bacterium]|nr:MFS transporter [Gammaproteobacteria bacterium]
MKNSSVANATTGAILSAAILSAIGIACWNLLPVTLGAAADSYSLSDQQLGLLGSSLLTGWLIATVPAFFYMKSINRRWVTVFGVSLAASGSIVSVFLDSILVLYISWAIAGFGMALIYCVSIQLIAELGDIERSFGYKIVAEVTGGAILLYIFPVFIISIWHYAGASFGVAITYMSALFFLRWITPFQPEEQESPERKEGSAPPAAWIAVIALLVFLSGVTGLWAFLERIGTDIGVSSNQMGVFLSILKLFGGLAGLTVILASAKFGVRWPHIAAIITIAVGVLLLHLAEDAYTYAVAIWIWEFGFSLGVAYQFAAIARLDTTNRLLLLVP